MHIRFITNFYPPEVGAPQIRIHELAKRLVQNGHIVSVLTGFPNYPTGVVPKEWRGMLWKQSTDDRIVVHRVWCYTAANRGFLKRVASQLSFTLSAFIAGLLLRTADVTIVESPPLFNGLTAIALRLLKRARYLFMVSDLWPESAVQMGILKHSVLISLSRSLERLAYRYSDAILALTKGIQHDIQSRVSRVEKVHLFRNSVSCDYFCPAPGSSSVRRQLGLSQDDFVALYAGTLGLAQNLTTVVNAAARLQESGELRIQFVLAGNGGESESLKTQARELHLQNLQIVGTYAAQRIPELINAADCVLVPLRRLELFRGALPTKMFEGMACAKPIILGIQGEAAELIEEAHAGLCISPDDPSALCEAVRFLMNNSEKAREMGLNGRRYVSNRFSRDSRTHELIDILERLPAVRRQQALDAIPRRAQLVGK